MAGVVKIGRNFTQLFRKNPQITASFVRSMSNSNDVTETEKQGWLSRLLTVRKIDPGRESHSMLLSDKDTVYELQTHSVKPECMERYLGEYEKFVETVRRKETGAQLAGSWTVEIGDQDQAIHLWKYQGGYPVLNKATQIYRTDKEFVDFRHSRNQMLRSRTNQILLSFSFWGPLKERSGNNLYEMRSYVLKPGTMIEWGNNWAKGIKFRQAIDEAVGGYFSHIGDLYQVHHFWAYSSMQVRDEIRDNIWHHPSWSECVSRTVPLIRHMTAKILIPTPFSPLQ